LWLPNPDGRCGEQRRLAFAARSAGWMHSAARQGASERGNLRVVEPGGLCRKQRRLAFVARDTWLTHLATGKVLPSEAALVVAEPGRPAQKAVGVRLRRPTRLVVAPGHPARCFRVRRPSWSPSPDARCHRLQELAPAARQRTRHRATGRAPSSAAALVAAKQGGLVPPAVGACFRRHRHAAASLANRQSASG
jgi:hypothetical protein